MRKPNPDEITRLREANPQGAPRIDYREMTIRAMPMDDMDGDECRMMCPDCGMEVPDDATTCPNCGSTIERAADGAMQQRDASTSDDRIPVAISSEHPVLRYDFWTDERYYEVLDHSPSSVDLSYARDGLPFVASHRASDADQQHGIVENVRVAPDRKLRGYLRMSKAQRSQEIGQDIRDGIRKKVSVGYVVGDKYDVTGTKNGIDVRTYREWMPLETSTVPIPADYSVGVGRALSAAGQEVLSRFLELHPSTTTAPQAQEISMADNAAAPGGANGSGAANVATTSGTPDIRVIERDANERAATRANNIVAMAAQHGLQDKAAEWLRAGKTEGEVAQEINNVLSARLAEIGTVKTSRGVVLSDKEYQRFSYARAMLQDGSLARELGLKVDIGFEREVVEEARKQTPMTTGQGGIFLPYVTTQSRANIDSATTTTGGPFKFTQPGDFIDLLRNTMSVTRAGATTLPGLTGPVSFPKQTGAATASWVGENPGSDMSRSNLTTSTVSLAFKTVQAATAVSRQALFSAASGNYDLEAIIRQDLAKVIAIAIDLGALNGSGSSNQPLGILQDTNVTAATALGTNGGTISWTSIVDLEYQVGKNNVQSGRMAYLTNALQRKQSRLIAPLGATNFGVPVWQSAGGSRFPDAGAGAPISDGVVNGYDAYVSNQVPSNLTKGTSTTVCSAWVFGAFEYLMIGMFGAGFEVLVDPYTLKLQNMVDLTAWNFVDVADRYPVAFSTLKDAL